MKREMELRVLGPYPTGDVLDVYLVGCRIGSVWRRQEGWVALSQVPWGAPGLAEKTPFSTAQEAATFLINLYRD